MQIDNITLSAKDAYIIKSLLYKDLGNFENRLAVEAIDKAEREARSEAEALEAKIDEVYEHLFGSFLASFDINLIDSKELRHAFQGVAERIAQDVGIPLIYILPHIKVKIKDIGSKMVEISLLTKLNDYAFGITIAL